MAAIPGWSEGGTGGSQKSGLTAGRSGGTGWSGQNCNKDSANIGDSGAAVSGMACAWGIAAKSIGGNGDGGARDHGRERRRRPCSDRDLSGSPGSARGICAQSEGAGGKPTHDRSDHAANVRIAPHEDMTVSNAQAGSGVSGGIVALNSGGGTRTCFAKGGHGGSGPLEGERIDVTEEDGVIVSSPCPAAPRAKATARAPASASRSATAWPVARKATCPTRPWNAPAAPASPLRSMLASAAPVAWRRRWISPPTV